MQRGPNSRSRAGANAGILLLEGESENRKFNAKKMSAMPPYGWEYSLAFVALLGIRPQNCSTHRTPVQRLDDRPTEVRFGAQRFAGVPIHRCAILASRDSSIDL